MQVSDIRELKTVLRGEYRAKRQALSAEEKRRRDEAVTRAVQALPAYRESETLLTYVSTAIEVDTTAIIRQALADGKRVAVPRCVPGTCEMEFYYLTSLDELHDGAFGVREPLPRDDGRVTDLSHGLCLVPALCYDAQGYRLGYGKGYYDRFLARFGGQTVGLCYNDCKRDTLPRGAFDRAVQQVVTD